MSNLHTLTPEEHKELSEWLVGKKIVLNHRTRRDLSDVVNMALLFKSVVGKMVNMKHYTSHGQLAKKVLNWETFSLNVLRKTNLILMRPALELLASGNMNAICSLLFHLMRIERNGIQLGSRRASPSRAKSQPEPSSDASTQSQETPVHSKHVKTHAQNSTQTMNDAPLPLPLPLPAPDENLNDMLQTPTQSKMDLQAESDHAQLAHQLRVTTEKYEEQLRINEKKEMYIVSLSQKIQYLERTIIEKEKRINQLLDQLSKLSVRIISMQTSIVDEPPPDKSNI
ncbi:hypothetical protein AWZ03_000779 [Drosophila navojoa]|uniref:CH-like domain-containing protein n=1 Tax=Drosophila navojoa TaxID=7232 RepID=A0A484BUQ7_DRONA|nr:hypothetical protein AWZ03_000779 [Drosophila navojoa]